MHVFICENTPNGILTGVYDAWELKIQERCSHADIYLVSGQPDNYELFCDYHTVAPSAEKAGSCFHAKPEAWTRFLRDNPYCYFIH